ncbi:hypothetical protein TUBRATIS_003270 [Tubulinosema ratisbonensis]|uniref:Uncharacterized protein n=1 Tax=Tubulinosema ratisbonensis TaxID=291195 RepID=A0A437AQ39_9MICR|nr:hypothetical protein TUBRATIS_003270 [Tubulinosema ratisbonensis]
MKNRKKSNIHQKSKENRIRHAAEGVVEQNFMLALWLVMINIDADFYILWIILLVLVLRANLFVSLIIICQLFILSFIIGMIVVIKSNKHIHISNILIKLQFILNLIYFGILFIFLQLFYVKMGYVLFTFNLNFSLFITRLIMGLTLISYLYSIKTLLYFAYGYFIYCKNYIKLNDLNPIRKKTIFLFRNSFKFFLVFFIICLSQFYYLFFSYVFILCMIVALLLCYLTPLIFSKGMLMSINSVINMYVCITLKFWLIICLMVGMSVEHFIYMHDIIVPNKSLIFTEDFYK